MTRRGMAVSGEVTPEDHLLDEEEEATDRPAEDPWEEMSGTMRDIDEVSGTMRDIDGNAIEPSAEDYYDDGE